MEIPKDLSTTSWAEKNRLKRQQMKEEEKSWKLAEEVYQESLKDKSLERYAEMTLRWAQEASEELKRIEKALMIPARKGLKTSDHMQRI